ncbi:MAG: G/U mismatch-specific DNA glycosylase [Mycobacteriales bacterium]
MSEADLRRRPSRAELLAAYGRTVPDLIRPGLRVLLCGINPSLWSGAVGLHFARPANRLWATLQLAGFTERRLHPSETGELLAAGIGVTNLVPEATARADEVSVEQLRAGVAPLTELVARCTPGYVAFLGLSAYRSAFGRTSASIGARPERLGAARVWLLPNPSGLNAHYQQPELTTAYAGLRSAAYGCAEGTAPPKRDGPPAALPGQRLN